MIGSVFRPMKEKVIVVSGGASGIGAELSARLAAEGAKVVIADLNGAQAEARAASIGTAGGSAFGRLRYHQP
jgi:NAD(P)-dependent dehydrogenase (short-subunit alcohol dehydrogenase family)